MTIYCLQTATDETMEKWAEAHDLDYHRYSDAKGFVVVASSEAEARRLVAVAVDKYHRDAPWWLDATVTSCEVVQDDGVACIVLGDWPTG